MPVNKTESKVVEKKQVAKVKIAEKSEVKSAAKSSNLSIPVFSMDGKTTANLTLAKEIFGVEVNNRLLAQAIRVYLSNKKVFTNFTKTRGEVVGSTIKIFKQKGTGRARHGAITAPIFVGGGITFGPKPRAKSLDLSKKMKKAALLSALSSKVAEKRAFILADAEKSSGKTKDFVQVLTKISDQKTMLPTLIVTGEKTGTVLRGVKNISGVTTLTANLLNAYEVLKHDNLVLTKDAVEMLTKGEQK